MYYTFSLFVAKFQVDSTKTFTIQTVSLLSFVVPIVTTQSKKGRH
ncbi:hypothetical protein [Flavobacterium sp.]